MDKLVDFLISNLQPAIDAIKNAAPDIIQREARWILYASRLEMNIGIGLLIGAGLCLVALLIGCLVWDFGDEHPGIAGMLCVIGVLSLIAGLICTIGGAITLRHMEINPTYVLLKHFMPGK